MYCQAVRLSACVFGQLSGHFPTRLQLPHSPKSEIEPLLPLSSERGRVQERLPPVGLQNDSEASVAQCCVYIFCSARLSSFLKELVLWRSPILSITEVSPPAERFDRSCCSVSTQQHLQGHLLWCWSLLYLQAFNVRHSQLHT